MKPLLVPSVPLKAVLLQTLRIAPSSSTTAGTRRGLTADFQGRALNMLEKKKVRRNKQKFPTHFVLHT